jgi:hypothetical protein
MTPHASRLTSAISLPPVIERELRIAFRKQKPVKARLRLTAILAGITAFFMLMGLVERGWAKRLHFILFLFGLMFVFKALRVSAGLFSEERRSQTMDLLFLTGMKSPELFATKLVSGLLVASSELLAIMPFFAIPFLAGGLSIQLFIATLVCLPALLLFFVAVGVLASVISTDEGAAMMTAVAIVAVLCLLTPVPYNIGLTLAGRAPFSPLWLSLSPAYPPWLVWKSFGATFPPGFWPSIGLTLLWTVVCLTSAAMILNRTWRNEPPHSVPKWRRTWQRWVQGTNEWRIALRRSLLDRNPFQWRVEQDRRPTVRAWIIVGAAAGLWTVGWIAWRSDWLTTVNFFATATLLILALYWLTLFSAAQQIGAERRDGTLELLLTTRLSPEEIVHGQLQASARQFHLPRLGALAFFLAMMILGFFIQPWNPLAVLVYLMIWAILGGFVIARPRNTIIAAIWVALISGRPAFAIFRLHGVGIGWIWMLYMLYRAAANFGKRGVQFPAGNAVEIVVVLIIGVIVMLVIFGRFDENVIRDNLRYEMRRIAQEPLPDRDDPRFKKWKDIKQPFPARHD